MSTPILISFLLLGMYVLKCVGSENAVRAAKSPTPKPQASDDVASVVEPATVPAVEPASSIEDDLTQIWGLGKGAAERLQEAGVTTFSQLAELAEAKLIELLGGQRMRANTWPEQARLAAAGDWQGLKAFQNDL